MTLAVSITILSIPVLAASVAGLGSVAATSIIRGHRDMQRIEQEFAMYDRAFEIYSRLPYTGEARSQLKVSDELIVLAALHACGGVDAEQYDKAKARITSRLIEPGSTETVGSMDSMLRGRVLTEEEKRSVPPPERASAGSSPSGGGRSSIVETNGAAL